MNERPDPDDASTVLTEYLCQNGENHAEEITYEDETGLQWMCRRCGAEGWEDYDD